MYDSSSIPGFNCLYDHVIVNHVTLWHYTFWFSNAAQPPLLAGYSNCPAKLTHHDRSALMGALRQYATND